MFLILGCLADKIFFYLSAVYIPLLSFWFFWWSGWFLCVCRRHLTAFITASRLLFFFSFPPSYLFKPFQLYREKASNPPIPPPPEQNYFFDCHFLFFFFLEMERVTIQARWGERPNGWIGRTGGLGWSRGTKREKKDHNCRTQRRKMKQPFSREQWQDGVLFSRHCCGFGGP